MKRLIFTLAALLLFSGFLVTTPVGAQIDYNFGVINFPKDDERTMQSLEELQTGFLRWNARWEELEQTKGTYDFDGLEDQLSPYAGQQILIMMTTKNPNYCAPYCIGDERLEKYPFAGGLPNDLPAYESFIEAFVGRFGSRISYLQIDNEINEYGAYWQDTIQNYTQVLVAAYHAVKQSAYPDLPVVVAGFASGHLDKLIQNDALVTTLTEDVLSTGAFDYLDLHFYHRYEDMKEKIDWLKQRGYSNLISTECSGPDLEEGFVADWEAEKSRQLIKRFSIGAENGLEKIIWFSFVNLPNNYERFKSLGLVNTDFQKNPAFFTYKLFLSEVGNYDSVQKISDGKYKFTAAGQTILILWNDNIRETFNARPYISSKSVQVTHIITEQGKTDEDAVIEIVPTTKVKLDATPILVEAYGK